MERTHYQVLGIEPTSTSDEIKRAYFKVVKQYPVDQYPEEFKLIRNAYDLLKNPQSRKKYDATIIHGDRLEVLQKKAMEFYGTDDFEDAKRLFNEILLIAPMQTETRHHSALCSLYLEEYAEALRQFNIVIQEEPDNKTYQLNYGIALEKCGKTEEAIRYYKKMYISMPNEMSYLFALADLYSNRAGEENKAFKTLDQAFVSQEKTGNFHAFYYLVKRIKIAAYLKNQSEFEVSIARCKEQLNKHEGKQNIILDELTDVGFALYRQKFYNYAASLFTFIQKEQAESAEELNRFVETAIHRADVYREFEQLERDQKVIEWVKNLFILYLFSDEFLEEEFNELTDRAFENLHDSSFYNPEETSRSIKRVLVKYPTLFETREDVLNDFMDMCNHIIQCHAEVKLLMDDRDICYPVKRLVLFYLRYFDTEDEKEEMMASIKLDITGETDYALQESVVRMISRYPALYRLNDQLFETFRREAGG